MIFFGMAHQQRSSSFFVLSAIAFFTLISPVNAQKPPTTAPTSEVKPQPLTDGQRIDNNSVRPLNPNNSLFSIPGGQKLIDEASNAISAQDYVLATKKLQESRQIFNQLSNSYQQLAGSFSGIDNRIADGLRRKALDTAQKRDEVTYQLALVHRAQNQPELAVPLLIQIIGSQNPTRDLGKKAYQQLLELGFVDVAFPRPRDSQSNQPTAPTQPSNPTPR